MKGVTEQSCDFILYYKQKEELKPIRFCAINKTKEEIEIEKKRISRKESKKQKSLSDDTKFTHKYFFVIRFPRKLKNLFRASLKTSIQINEIIVK